MKSKHELLRIEEISQPLPAPSKYRFVCSCGDVGIAVGSAGVPGEPWARRAFDYHKAQVSYQ